MKKAFLRNGASVGRLVNKARSVGSSGGIAESNNRSSRTTRIQSTGSSEGEGDKSYLCKWGGREGACERQPRNWRRTQSNDEGGEELALRGTNDSSYSHAAPPSPRLNPSPWNPPLGSRKGSQRGQRRVLGRVEPPTIFRDRNLILSDVNQERERGRKRERKASYVPPSPTLLLPLLSTRPTPRPFIFSIFNRWMGAVTIIFTIRRTDWMIDSRLFQAVCPS